MPIHILIVDDHAVVRQGLKMFLRLDAEFIIVGEAANGEEAVRLAHQVRPDVVLMDLVMPVMDGIRATRVIRQERPEIEIIALTSVLEDQLVVDAIKAGAISYLFKDTQTDELGRAIRAAAAGRVQLSARLLREIPLPESPADLTEQETEVLRLLANSKTNLEIASELNLGENTVKAVVDSVMVKLGVSSRMQAALFAVGNGLAAFEDAHTNP